MAGFTREPDCQLMTFDPLTPEKMGEIAQILDRSGGDGR